MTLLMRIGVTGIPAGQAGRGFLKEIVKAVARVDCVDNAVDGGAIGHDGAVHSVGSTGGKNFIVESDFLVFCNLFGAAIAQLQIDFPAVGRFNHLTLQQHIAFLKDANLALGVGGGNFPLHIIYLGNSGLGHDDLLE